jgi:tetratricopeptide (TPR) repeat protein
MNGRYAEADRYYREALQSYARLGRARSPNTLSIRNNWAVASSNAGVPRRSLELYDATLQQAAQRDPSNTPPGYVVVNRARALAQLGRYREAGQAYERAVQLLASQNNPIGEAYCSLGMAFLAIEQADPTGAAAHLQRAAAVLQKMPRDSAVWVAYDLMDGRLALLKGHVGEAGRVFDTVLAGKPNDTNRVDAYLGKAETDLLVGDTAAAARQARQALELSQRLQGGLPYSNRTGLAWLALARAAQSANDAAPAREAFASAVLHLSNTVDPDHPALVQARTGTVRKIHRALSIPD